MSEPIEIEAVGGGTVEAESPEELRIINAVSPTVITEQIEGGAVITVTDLHGVHTVTLGNGADGRGIANAVLNNDYTLTLTFTDGTSYTTPSIRGAQGRGIISITKIGSSGLVDAYMITYSDGDPSMFYVTNGADGISPTVEMAPITGGYRITFTDKNGPHSVDLMNGVNGISPAVITQSITGGNRVTITDAEHPNGQTFDVMDGPAGPGVASGGTQGQMLVKKSGTDYDTEWANQPSVPVQDVQVNGVSVLTDGVANVPISDGINPGVVIPNAGDGIAINTVNGKLYLYRAGSTLIKNGAENYKAIVPGTQHESTFYGLAKAAGADMASSSNPVGTYTAEAKHKIKKMLGIPDIGEAELISELTTTEDLALINIDVDNNGNAFKLAEAYICIESPASPSGAVASYQVRLKHLNSSGDQTSSTFPSVSLAASSSKVLMYRFSSRNGIYTLLSGSGSSRFNLSNAQFSMSSTDIIHYINGLTIKQANESGIVIPSGTHILFYGCRLYDD